MGCEIPVFNFIYRPYFCLDFSQVKRWLEDESGKILKQTSGKAAYTATLVKYAELICKKPCGQAMLYNFSAGGGNGSGGEDEG